MIQSITCCYIYKGRGGLETMLMNYYRHIDQEVRYSSIS